MGLFDWLFGKRDDRPSAYDPAGSIAIVVQNVSGPLTSALKGDGLQVDAFDHEQRDLMDRIAGSGRSCVVIEIESAATNGFLIHQKIKRDGRLQAIPVVIFSTEVDEETFAQHRKLRTRAEAYVTGNGPDEIRAAVRSLLQGSSSS